MPPDIQKVDHTMEKVRKSHYKGKEILIVDYSDCRGDSIIDIFEKAKKLISEEKGHHLILNVTNNKTTITPSVMRHIEREVPKFEQYIDRQAIIGLSQIQKWIIKGMNLWYAKQIHSFESIDDALEFLTMDEINNYK